MPFEKVECGQLIDGPAHLSRGCRSLQCGYRRRLIARHRAVGTVIDPVITIGAVSPHLGMVSGGSNSVFDEPSVNLRVAPPVDGESSGAPWYQNRRDGGSVPPRDNT